MRELIFEIEGLVQPKQSARFAKIGNFMRSYQPKRVVDYSNFVKNSFKAKYPEHVPYTGLILLKIEAFFVIPKSYTKKKIQIISEQNYYAGKKPDCDNICKQICDSLNGVAWEDDRQVVRVCITKQYADREYVRVSMLEV